MHLGPGGLASVHHHASFQLPGFLRRDLIADPRQIGLVHLHGGMQHPFGQVAVVGEQQQPLAVVVQPPHRVQPDGIIPETIQHCGASLRVADGRYLASGLVIYDIMLFHFGPDALPVHADDLIVLHLHAHFRNFLTVYRDVALGDQLFRRPAGSHSAGGQILLQPHGVPPCAGLARWKIV